MGKIAITLPKENWEEICSFAESWLRKCRCKSPSVEDLRDTLNKWDERRRRFYDEYEETI